VIVDAPSLGVAGLRANERSAKRAYTSSARLYVTRLSAHPIQMVSVANKRSIIRPEFAASDRPHPCCIGRGCNRPASDSWDHKTRRTWNLADRVAVQDVRSMTKAALLCCSQRGRRSKQLARTAEKRSSNLRVGVVDVETAVNRYHTARRVERLLATATSSSSSSSSSSA